MKQERHNIWDNQQTIPVFYFYRVAPFTLTERDLLAHIEWKGGWVL